MPAYMDPDDLKDYVRSVGLPGTSSVSDAQLDWQIEAARAFYSKVRPLYAAGKIQTVVGQQEYPLEDTISVLDDSVEAEVIELHDVIYTPAGFLWGITYNFTLPIWWKLNVGEFYVFNQPTIGYTWLAQMKHLEAITHGEWQVMERADGKNYLILMPAPSVAFELPIEYKLLRPLEMILKSDLNIFHLCVLAESYGYMAGSAGVAQSFSDSGMSIDMGRGAQFYADLAEQTRLRVYSLTMQAAVGRTG